MQQTEVTGKTREEAIAKALKELGVERYEVNVEILDEGSRGLFGLGARDVRIRVTAEGLPDKPDDRKRPEEPEERVEPARPRAEGEERAPREKRGEGRERPRQREPRRQERQEAGPERPRDDRSRAEASDGPSDQPVPADPAARKAEVLTPEARKELEAFGEEAAELLREVIGRMQIECSVSSRVDDDNNIILDVSSPDSAILIGRKGRSLQALQYLLNRMVDRETESRNSERITIDVERYLARRRESLEDQARELADKAKSTGREFRMKPLSPQERRIIHLVLEDDPEVRTFSLGSSVQRRVVVAPMNGAEPGSRGGRSRGGASRKSRGGRRRGPRSRGQGNSEARGEDRSDAGDGS